MSQIPSSRFCLCGSGRPLAACCAVYLNRHRDPPTAEALMRSRYTAFALGDERYLLDTWDPTHRPARLDLKGDRTEWLGLRIVSCEAGGETDIEGRVQFIARFRLRGNEQVLCEDSRFRKEADRWLYVDGQMADTPGPAATAAARPTVGRNEPCPCGSGQKFKRCCGK